MKKYLVASELEQLENIYQEVLFETKISLYSYENKFSFTEVTILPVKKFMSCYSSLENPNKFVVVLDFFLKKSNYVRVTIKNKYLEEFQKYDILSQTNYGNDFISLLLMTNTLNGLLISKNIDKFEDMTFFYENKIIGSCCFYNSKLNFTYRVELPLNKKLNYDESIEIFYYYEIDNNILKLKFDFFNNLLSKLNMYMSFYKDGYEFMYFNFYNKTIINLYSKKSDINSQLDILSSKDLLTNKENNHNILLLKSFDNGIYTKYLFSDIVKSCNDFFDNGGLN